MNVIFLEMIDVGQAVMLVNGYGRTISYKRLFIFGKVKRPNNFLNICVCVDVSMDNWQ